MSLYVHKDVRNRVKVRLFEQGAEFGAPVGVFAAGVAEEKVNL